MFKGHLVLFSILAIILVPLAGNVTAEVEAPLKQLKHTSAEMVQCNSGLELVLKMSDNTPACVTPDTKVILLERGWAMAGEMMLDEMMDDEMMLDEIMDGSMMDDEIMDGSMMDDEIMDGSMMDDEIMDGSMINGSMINGSMINGSMINGSMMDDEIMDGSMINGSMMDRLVLTSEEQTWLNENPIIKVAYDPNWIPLEFFNNTTNDIDGLSLEYMQLFEQMLNVDFQPSEIATWEAALNSIMNKESHVIFMIADTEERREGYNMNFTEHHTNFKTEIIMLKSNEYIQDKRDQDLEINELVDLKVSTITGFAIESWLDNNHPEIEYISKPNVSEQLKLLKSGEVDAILGVWPVVKYQATQMDDIGELHSAGELGFSYDLAIGYQKSLSSTLGSILEKTLDKIPQDKRDQLRMDRLADLDN